MLVTGAAGQIGAACVEAFAREGARVGAVDRAARRRATATGFAVAADLSREDEIVRAFARGRATRSAPLDVLVQSAAVIARVPYLEIDAANIDHVLGINVRAILLGGRVAARSMIDRGLRDGAIVNLTSVSALVADAESVAYEASKGPSSGHPGHGAGPRAARHPGQRGRARVDGEVPGAGSATRSTSTTTSAAASRCSGWAPGRRSPRPSSSWPRRRPPTSQAPSSGPMVEISPCGSAKRAKMAILIRAAVS